MQKFARPKDRGRARYFVGRTDICQKIQGHLQKSITDWQEKKPTLPWADQTTLLQGAPGAGKSALLAHLAGTLPDAVQSHRPLRVCRLSVADLAAADDWQKRLAEALQPGSKEKMETMSAAQVSGGVKLFGLQVGGQVTEQQPQLTWERLRTAYHKNPRDFHPVLLVIDEVQNVRQDQEDAIARQLAYFHEAPDQLPVFPLYGGLGYTRDQFMELGLSRLTRERVHTLPCLREVDCHDATARFLGDGEFGIQYSKNHLIGWQKRIADWSHGWPQHLTIALQELAAGIARDSDHRLETVSCEQVFNKVQTGKADYYENRLKNNKLENRDKLAELGVLRVASGQRPPPTIANVSVALAQLAEGLGTQNPSFALPDGYSGQKFAKAMLEAGLLHKNEKRQLEVPIPSLVTYILDGDLRTVLQAQRQHLQPAVLTLLDDLNTEPSTPAPVITDEQES